MSKVQLENDVLQPSKVLKGSALRRDMPEDFVAAKKYWASVVQAIENHLEDLRVAGGDVDGFLTSINQFYEFSTIDGFFKKSCWSWAPSGKTLRFDETDRMGQHFFGAMYTCEEYEWPQHEGCPFKPFFQLDLDLSSEIAGVYVGSGLLQLYETPAFEVSEGYFLRHIPRENVSEDQVTQIPSFNKKQARQIKDAYVSDLDRIFGVNSECIGVDGFTDMRFSMPFQIDEFDDLSCVLEESGVDSLVTAATHLGVIETLFNNLRGDIGEKYFDLALFGFVAPIQCDFWEMPDPILRLGACRSLIEGWKLDYYFDVYGDGNGQVYFETNSEGALCYKFYGDC